jgi:hypothetical protein
MLTLERLKYLMSYDPETGLWRRLVHRGGRAAGNVICSKNADGYIHFPVDGTMYRSAPLAWFYMTGERVEELVDHRDLNKANDRWDNLRLATCSQNKANSPAYANNALQIKGVRKSESHRSKPFRARIQVNKAMKHLGYFATAGEASAAYTRAAEIYFGEFANSGMKAKLIPLGIV